MELVENHLNEFMMLQPYTIKVLDGLQRINNTVLTISEKYTLEPDPYAWRLDIKTPSDHHKSKSGYIIQSRWYPKLSMVLAFILDNELKEVDGTLVELTTRLEEITEEVKNLAEAWEKKYK
jgi:hypothetical protein